MNKKPGYVQQLRKAAREARAFHQKQADGHHRRQKHGPPASPSSLDKLKAKFSR